ncbi:HNH endonuclease [Candidatus Latescibacterota bacterium]
MSESASTEVQLALPLASAAKEPSVGRQCSKSRPRRPKGSRRPTAAHPEPLRCQQCGGPIEVPDWYRDHGLSLHYCSSECRMEWARSQPTFEVRPQSRRGRGGNWEAQSRRARKRDGYACRICGVTEEELGRRLDVHHKIPYRGFRSNVEANKLEHLISVCPPCHQQVEAQVRRELPLFSQSPGQGQAGTGETGISDG